jgi:hypothetical protein
MLLLLLYSLLHVNVSQEAAMTRTAKAEAAG